MLFQTASRLQVEVHLGVPVADTAALFDFVDRIVCDGKRVRAGAVSRQLMLRQSRRGTGLGNGVAIPHAAVRHLVRPRLIYIRSLAAIDMDTPDRKPVNEALTLLVRYPPSPADHALLERLRNPRMNPVLLDLLRRGCCDDAVAHLAAGP